jgi:hypothetical protein
MFATPPHPDPPPGSHKPAVIVPWAYSYWAPTNKPGLIAFCLVPAHGKRHCLIMVKGPRH